MAAEPVEVTTLGMLLGSLRDQLRLSGKEVIVGPYLFLITLVSYSEIRVGLRAENGVETRGDDVVDFIATPAHVGGDKLIFDVKPRRVYVNDYASQVVIQPGTRSVEAVLRAILRVCHDDMNAIRTSPRTPLHVVDVFQRTVAAVRART